MLVQRVLTAALGIPVIVALILIGGAAYAIAVAAVLAICVIEFFNAVSLRATDAAGETLIDRLWQVFLTQQPIAYVAALATVILVIAADNGFDEWTGALAGGIALAFVFLILRGRTEGNLQDWLHAIAAVAYIGFLGSHLILLRDGPNGEEWVLLAVFSTFIADTLAYFVGRAIGRTKIVPEISPGKTVEGTAAGIVAGIVSVFAFNWALDLDVDADEIASLAVLLPVAAFFGDLAESMIKRGAGIKDTSDFVPGHGGFLDRFDAVLFTTPLVYYWLIWVVL